MWTDATREKYEREAHRYEQRVPCSIIALLEKESSISRKMLKYAANRLTALPIFEGDRQAAIQRIEREVTGIDKTIH